MFVAVISAPNLRSLRLYPDRLIVSTARFPSLPLIPSDSFGKTVCVLVCVTRVRLSCVIVEICSLLFLVPKIGFVMLVSPTLAFHPRFMADFSCKPKAGRSRGQIWKGGEREPILVLRGKSMRDTML